MSKQAAQAPALHPQNVLLGLIALRIVNALTTRTFFQPDEYFQALEPAWQIAFGSESGAWITWVSLQLHINDDTNSFAGMEAPAALVYVPRPLRRSLLYYIAAL